LDFAQQVVDAGALYFTANPAVADRLKALTQQNRTYLAHEYFGGHWDPMPFSRVAGLLAEAKLDFAASANLLENMDRVNLSAQGQELIGELAHPILKESLRDYLLNQQFRKDIFIKGRRPMTPSQQMELLEGQKFILTAASHDIPMQLQGPASEIRLHEEVYRPLIEILSENKYAPKPVSKIYSHPRWERRGIETAVEALAILTAGGFAHPVQTDAAIETARPRCRALNSYICERARYDGESGCVASPVIGGGVPIDRLEQLFLHCRESGKTEPGAWATFTWDVLEGQGQRVIKDGKVIETPEANRAELHDRARKFQKERLPILQALGIAD
jgi:hypothetical protein